MVTNNSWNSEDPAQVAKGGTGASSLTDHAVLVGSGTSPVTPLAVANEGELLVGASTADPAFGTSADGDFTFTSATASTKRSLSVTQTDNTSGTSDADLLVSTGGTASGDPSVTFSITGTQSYSMGIDNSAADELVITDSTGPSAGNKLWDMTSDGERTMPLQPAFFANITALIPNVTGNGTQFLIPFNNTRFDQGGDFNTGTGIFTAPKTGRYQFFWRVRVEELVEGSSTTTFSVVETSNIDYEGMFARPGSAMSAGKFNVGGGVLCDMDAADTANVIVTSDGLGLVVDIESITTGVLLTHFSGSLVC